MSERLEQLQKMVEQEPNDPFLPYAIALEHGKAEHFEEAITWLDRTLEIDRHYCYAFFQKAKMYSEMGEDDQARKALEDGMERAAFSGDDKAYREMAELLGSL